MSDPICLVYTTCASSAEAETLGSKLVQERLAACATRTSGAVSIYPWRGKLERSEEVQLTLKTTTRMLSRLEKRLLDLHSYDCPEFVVVPAQHVSQEYADWLRSWVAVPPSPL